MSKSSNINYKTPDGDVYRPPKKREPAGPADKNLLAWEYSPESRELRQLIAFIEESTGAGAIRWTSRTCKK